MSQEKHPSGLQDYEDIYIEVFYPENIPSELRNSLEQELGDNYREKYTIRLPAPTPQPIISVTHQDEVHTLFGKEITYENIGETLED